MRFKQTMCEALGHVFEIPVTITVEYKSKMVEKTETFFCSRCGIKLGAN